MAGSIEPRLNNWHRFAGTVGICCWLLYVAFQLWEFNAVRFLIALVVLNVALVVALGAGHVRSKADSSVRGWDLASCLLVWLISNLAPLLFVATLFHNAHVGLLVLLYFAMAIICGPNCVAVGRRGFNQRQLAGVAIAVGCLALSFWWAVNKGRYASDECLDVLTDLTESRNVIWPTIVWHFGVVVSLALVWSGYRQEQRAAGGRSLSARTLAVLTLGLLISLGTPLMFLAAFVSLFFFHFARLDQPAPPSVNDDAVSR